MKPTVLIVDDEKHTREGLQRALEHEFDVYLAQDAQTSLNLLESEHFDLMLADLRMPGMDGLKLIKRALSLTRPPICILMTAYGTYETGVEAMKIGAYDCISKPVNLDELEVKIKKAIRSQNLEKENVELKQRLDEKYGLENIIGSSEPMKSVYEVIQQVAPSRATVLIQGASGTGKELVAHAIHQLSPRKNGPYVAVHCAALATNLLESELFGHERGAFTGAIERRQGRFELADGGTLFLDEIGEIDPQVQVKVLRVLEERQFERVGGQKTISTDVRLIAATNRDLGELVRVGKFRDDLYFRLNVVTIHLPLLRERVEDIPVLVNHFLTEYARENSKPSKDLTQDAMNALLAYSWPGNVRELRNYIERAVVLGKGDKITLRELPQSVRDQLTYGANGTPSPARTAKSEMTIEEAEKQMVIRALKETSGNRTEAAKRLGISRRTLHRKLHVYQLMNL
ncbi:MAG: sigma-54-dependent Fis family transcriptional regulator [Verrucomicrobiae bacterium]|nr:sigma-54-dependent Fis family transcriptional regulator [Verrucomicrobiae bacterium]